MAKGESLFLPVPTLPLRSTHCTASERGTDRTNTFGWSQEGGRFRVDGIERSFRWERQSSFFHVCIRFSADFDIAFKGKARNT